MITSLLFFIATAHASDVCDIRPDLCGKPARAIKGQAKKKKRKAKTREIDTAADDLEKEMIEEQSNRPRRNVADARKRKTKPLDRQTSASFEAYLNENSTNPALSGRVPASQSAFQPAKRSYAPAQNRPDPTVTAAPFSSGSSSNSANGGFSSPPMTLSAPAAESSGPTPQMPAPASAAEQPANGGSSDGPLR